MGKYYENEITPYDDVYMTYDDTRHQYKLTIKAVDDEFNVNLIEYAGDEKNAESILREIRGDFYKYVYKYNLYDERKRRVDEHRLAKNGDFRDIIRESMLDMARALIRSGYSLDKDLSWVNTETSTVMDLSDIPSIAPDAIDGMLAYGILHKGRYNYSIDDEDYRSDY